MNGKHVADTYPYFSFFPALPLSKTLQFGDWLVGNPSMEAKWRSNRFKDLARAHLDAFAREGFKDGALMWHRERGFDGSMPDASTWLAIQNAVCFSVLDDNDHVRHGSNAGYYFATSENAELYTQPIDEERATISQRQGGLLRNVLSGGWKIGQETVSLPDATIAISRPLAPSQCVARAVFTALLDTTRSESRRIAVALEWHRIALSNPRVVSWPQRIVALKTGFEALSGKSKTHRCAQFLRNLFEDTMRPHIELLPWAGVLWSPTERTDLARTWTKNGTVQHVVRSELEDWFTALGDARNEIIHQGTFSKNVYNAPPERPLSRYAGLLFWTAERVLREAVKAMLGAEVLLCGRLREAQEAEKLVKGLRKMMAEEQRLAGGDTNVEAPKAVELEPEPDDVETASPVPEDDLNETSDNGESDLDETTLPAFSETAARSLSVLLATLNCDSAKKIRLEKAVAQPSGSLEAARANSKAVRGYWGASFAKKSILINRAERDILQKAGAEFPLPQYWRRCD